MSKSILTMATVVVVAFVAACDRAPVETTTSAVISTPVVPLSSEPVYTGKFK
ncbi:MAG: hypothetical protein P8L68_00420 [Paracoccaceae bacterium]|nr:hypothetical protein [Paracoccaceae bacterium]MDG1738094.1 hypothetical protein [Paracoccaceae bacterium]MDG2256947.1 hypothetical protein [Paracoccaceae bacterium]